MPSLRAEHRGDERLTAYSTERWGWESIGVAIENPIREHVYVRPDYRNGAGFLHYDGTVNALDDPPTSTTTSINFREHAARFAHQLDAAMGHHTLASADERDSLTVRQTLSDMIGERVAALRRVGNRRPA